MSSRRASWPAARIISTKPGVASVRDTFSPRERLGLREVQAGANVLLATSMYNVIYARSQNVDGVWFVAPSQAVVDLLTGPGRNPAEAEALLDWIERNSHGWRR
jgi:hypothetical protein